MEISAFDIQQARVKQVLFKSRLRSVLYGVRAADPALFSRPDNPLGQWLDAVVKPRYGHHPEVREIETTLQQLLATPLVPMYTLPAGDTQMARSRPKPVRKSVRLGMVRPAASSVSWVSLRSLSTTSSRLPRQPGMAGWS